MRLGSMFVAILAGCFHPGPPEGAPCSSNGECPSPLTCNGGTCTRSPADALGDASESDAFVIPDADLSCSCTGANTLTCSQVNMTCALGCVSPTSGARCKQVVPSNSIDVALVTTVSTTITVNSAAVFNTDTGEITGAVVRGPGEGVINNIGFAKHTHQSRLIGVFVISALDVTQAGTIRFVGARAAALLGRTIAVAGKLDAAAGCGGTDKSCPGPGGDPGVRYGATTIGACAGKNGTTDAVDNNDGGGGGGGGGAVGGTGGPADAFAGGVAGAACLPATLEPLRGGGGGGGGGLGQLAMGSIGGGGGGGLQITALESITVAGTITANGAGGQGGMGVAGDGPAGSGGGAGGALLFESPTVTFQASAIIVANGGGGGGAAHSASTGADGEDGKLGLAVAAGGAPGMTPSTAGGAGGANTTAAVSAGTAPLNGNGGGGGGAVGRVFMRGTVTGTPTISPPATSGALNAQ